MGEGVDFFLKKSQSRRSRKLCLRLGKLIGMSLPMYVHMYVCMYVHMYSEP